MEVPGPARPGQAGILGRRDNCDHRCRVVARPDGPHPGWICLGQQGPFLALHFGRCRGISDPGGLLPYGLGRAGGELFLLKRVNRENFEKMRIRFERQEFLAVLVPSMLPPPTPWKAIIFAAGVFEMHVMPFMLAVFVGRVVRWLILSLLVIKLGPTAVSIVEHMISDHLQIFLGSLVLIFLAIGIWAILKMRKGGDSARPPKATQGEIK